MGGSLTAAGQVENLAGLDELDVVHLGVGIRHIARGQLKLRANLRAQQVGGRVHGWRFQGRRGRCLQSGTPNAQRGMPQGLEAK